jgi:hypothetical protein
MMHRLGSEGVVEKAFNDAGFINVKSELIVSPLYLSSGAWSVKYIFINLFQHSINVFLKKILHLI